MKLTNLLLALNFLAISACGFFLYRISDAAYEAVFQFGNSNQEQLANQQLDALAGIRARARSK